ncbi:MAG: DUF6873 family GME fold protein [Acutalibacteraceae bacterium]
MTDFVKEPNLPQGKVKSVICGDIPIELREFLRKRDIDIIFCGENPDIDGSVAFHCDMAAIHLGGKKIVADKNRADLIKRLTDLKMNVIESHSEIKGDYPRDIILNFAIIGDCIIGNQKHIDENLKNEITHLKIIDVKQGYAKCSILPISEKAFITDDVSIYQKCSALDFDVILIKKGDIRLKGQNYGFIGGAAGKISQDEVLFFGDLSFHQNEKEILSFLKKHNCKAICINGMSLTDIGGIIPLTQEV